MRVCVCVCVQSNMPAFRFDGQGIPHQEASSISETDLAGLHTHLEEDGLTVLSLLHPCELKTIEQLHPYQPIYPFDKYLWPFDALVVFEGDADSLLSRLTPRVDLESCDPERREHVTTHAERFVEEEECDGDDAFEEEEEDEDYEDHDQEDEEDEDETDTSEEEEEDVGMDDPACNPEEGPCLCEEGWSVPDEMNAPADPSNGKGGIVFSGH